MFYMMRCFDNASCSTSDFQDCLLKCIKVVVHTKDDVLKNVLTVVIHVMKVKIFKP